MKRYFSALGMVSVVLLIFGVASVRAETVVIGVEENTTWTKSGSPYIIDAFRTCDVGADDEHPVTLTIEAGTEVVFRESDTLRFGSGAALVVNGTQSQPVTFRSHATDGIQRWQLTFGKGGDRPRNGACVLEYAVFQGGGSGSPTLPMIAIDHPGEALTLRHCQFRDGKDQGLRIGEGCAVKVENCHFENNGNAAIWYYNPSSNQASNYVHNCHFERQGSVDNPAIEVELHSSGAVPGLSGNTGDNDVFVLVEPLSGTGSVELEFPSMTWALPGKRDNGASIPYVMDSPLEYGSPEGMASVLTIARDNVIQMQGGGFLIERNAAIRIEGTADEPILFTNTTLWDDDEPRWRKIGIRDSARASSCVIEHATFEYGADGEPGMIAFENETTGNALTISSCEFRNSEDVGIYIEQTSSELSSPMTIQDCDFHDNKGEDIYFRGGHAEDPTSRIADCRFYNATNDTTSAIRFTTCRLDLTNLTGDNKTFFQLDDPTGEVSGDLRLTFPGNLDNGNPIPYVIPEVPSSNGWHVHAEEGAGPVNLIIDAGCVIRSQKFSQKWAPLVKIGRNAAIMANGTETSPIVFSTTDRWDPDNTEWRGITITDEARGAACVFSHTTVEGAGTALETESSGAFIAMNCVFRDSEDGVYIAGGASGILRGCRFEECEDNGLLVGTTSNNADPSTVTVTGSSFTSNGAGIHFRNPAEGIKVETSSFIGNLDFGIRNDEEISVDARSCDWGHATGPLDDSDDEDTNFALGAMYFNPNGEGDRVSDDVLYSPWGLERMVNLTIRVSDCTIGGTWPLTGTHEVPAGVPVSIAVIPVCGASFDGWTIKSGNATLAEAGSSQTTVTPMADTVLEAGLSGEVNCFRRDFEAWAQTKGVQSVSDGGFDPLHDSSGNGVPDALAFAMGLEPLSAAVPMVESAVVDGAFRITYPAAIDAQHTVTYVVEGSVDLVSFTPIATGSVSIVGREPREAIEMITAEVTSPAHRYFRINVDY